MSLKTWRAEFYPYSAARCSKADALGHSLRKWRGLRLRARERHGLGVADGALYDRVLGRRLFEVDSSTCALCKHHLDLDLSCETCPLAKVRDGYPCDMTRPDEDRSPYFAWRDHSDPAPMIRLLERAARRAARAAK